MVDDSLNHGVIPARKFGWNALWVARGRKEKYTNKIDDLRGIFDFLWYATSLYNYSRQYLTKLRFKV